MVTDNIRDRASIMKIVDLVTRKERIFKMLCAIDPNAETTFSGVIKRLEEDMSCAVIEIINNDITDDELQAIETIISLRKEQEKQAPLSPAQVDGFAASANKNYYTVERNSNTSGPNSYEPLRYVFLKELKNVLESHKSGSKDGDGD